MWADSQVRVHIRDFSSELQIEGSGLLVEGINSSEVFSEIKPVALIPQQKISIQNLCKGAHLFWSVQLDQQPAKIITSSLLRVRGFDVRVNGKPSSRELLFTRSINNSKIQEIAKVPLEEYVAGVVSQEMPLLWPLEALKAQAIATRSYTLAVIKQKSHHLIQLESTVTDQVFAQLDIAQVQDPKYMRVLQAVRDTQGVVLKNQQGRTLKAFYHSDCAGQTGSSAGILGVPGLRGGVQDPSCPLRKESRWKSSVRDEILSKVFGQDVSQLQLRTETSGHVLSVLAFNQNNLIGQLTSQKFREKLGFDRIKSNHFGVQRTPEGWIFQGLGRGHGVGMCQWGSKSLASLGQSSAQILAHYYPEAHLSDFLEAGEHLHSKEANGDDHKHLFE